MFEQYKRRLLFQFKKIQIDYKAWRNSREIAKAYDQPQSHENRIVVFFRKYSLRLVIVTSALLVLCALGFGGWQASKHVKSYITAFSKKMDQEKKARKLHKVKKETNNNSLYTQARDSLSGSSALVMNSKSLEKSTTIISIGWENIRSFIKGSGEYVSRINLKIPRIDSAVAGMKVKTAENPVIASKGADSITAQPDSSLTPVESRTDKVLSVKKSDIKADYYMVIANKATKAMYLLSQQDMTWKIIKEYKIAIGAGLSGPKAVSGDKKTPEGLYFIVSKKEKHELTSIYGPLAYVLNYPNEDDRKAGRTGQGIWIHGTQSDSAPVPTKGCLSLANNDIVDLAKNLQKGIGTPVLIINDTAVTDPALKADYAYVDTKRTALLGSHYEFNDSLAAFVKGWIEAWESRDITRYESFYLTSEFNSQGMKWDAWKEKKVATFRAYRTINVEVESMKIQDVSDAGYEIQFLQHYRSDQKYFENAKQLSLRKQSGMWKIVREITISKEELLL